MATKTFYLNDGVDANGFQALTTTTVTANNTAAGWVVGTGSTNHSALFANTERASATFTATTDPNGAIDTTNKDCFRSPEAYSGRFASANWAIQFAVRSPTQGGAADGRIRFRLLKANADGSSAVEITAAQQQASLVSNVTSAADSNSTSTLNPGAFTVTNQYLFLEIAWERTGAGGMTTTNIRFRTGSASTPTGTVITTSDFVDANISATCNVAFSTVADINAETTMEAVANVAFSTSAQLRVPTPVVTSITPDTGEEGATEGVVIAGSALNDGSVSIVFPFQANFNEAFDATEDWPHAMAIVGGFIYVTAYTSATGLARILKIDPDDPGNPTVQSFPNDGKHGFALAMVYVPAKDRLYVGFYAGSATGKLCVSEVNPSDLSHTDVVDETHTGEEIEVHGLAYDATYLYVLYTNYDTQAVLARFALSGFANSGTITGLDQACHSLAIDSTSLFVGTSQTATAAKLYKFSISGFVSTSPEQLDSGLDAGTDDLALTDDYVFMGLEGINDRVIRFNKADITDWDIIDTSSETGSVCWGVFTLAEGVIALFNEGIILVIDPDAMTFTALNVGISNINELASTDAALYLTRYQDPGSIVGVQRYYLVDEGITVNNLTLVNDSQITADFVIDADTAPGERYVAVQTQGGTSNSVTFEVTAAAGNDITATANVAFSTVADINATGDLDATASGTFTVAADINAPGTLAATANVVFSTSVDINATGTLAATAATAFSTAADINAPGTIAATASVTFTTAANLTGAAQNDLTATANVVFATVADINAAGTIAATANVVFTTVADINAPGTIAATANAVFSLVVDINATGRLAAATAAAFSATADIAATGTLAATAATSFTATANLTAASAQDIAATANVVFSTAADINAPGTLAATAATAFSTAADINAPGTIAATANAVFSTAADISAAGTLAATSAAAFTTAADVNAAGQLSATASLTFTTTADLGEAESQRLNATVALTFASSPSLRAVGRLSGTVVLTTSVVADIYGKLEASAATASAFTTAAHLLGAGELRATVQLQATTAATLNAIARIAATLNLIFDCQQANLVNANAGDFPPIGEEPGVESRTPLLEVHSLSEEVVALTAATPHLEVLSLEENVSALTTATHRLTRARRVYRN